MCFCIILEFSPELDLKNKLGKNLSIKDNEEKKEKRTSLEYFQESNNFGRQDLLLRLQHFAEEQGEGITSKELQIKISSQEITLISFNR